MGISGPNLYNLRHSSYASKGIEPSCNPTRASNHKEQNIQYFQQLVALLLLRPGFYGWSPCGWFVIMLRRLCGCVRMRDFWPACWGGWGKFTGGSRANRKERLRIEGLCLIGLALSCVYVGRLCGRLVLLEAGCWGGILGSVVCERCGVCNRCLQHPVSHHHMVCLCFAFCLRLS